METSTLAAGPGRARRGRDLLLVAVFTIALHAPFLTQPVQGDEVTYLDIARHALRQPLTPLNFQYVFQGRRVDASGHPHPPLNGYLLALAWTLRGHFSVLFFHAFYLLFALGAAVAGYALAARFTPQPLWGALLLAASPIVQVNANTLASPESPALAFLLAGAAAFFWRRFGIAAVALTMAGMTELQALALPPILLLEYVFKRERPPRAAWLALAAPFMGLAAWEALQWGLTHRFPGAVLLGYAQSGSFSGLGLKAASAMALLGHLGVLVTPSPLARRRLWTLVPGLLAAILASGYLWWERALLLAAVALGANALLWLWECRRRNAVLAAWCLLYFGFAALVFFAGAARYLLPLAAPMVLLFVLQFQERPRWLALALGVNVVLGLSISFAAYEFSRIYAEVPSPPGPSFLVNGDWGFRYYMLAHGGRVLETTSIPRPGEWIVSSALSLAGNYDSLAEETAVPLRFADVQVRTPLRLIDRYAHSGFSSASSGLLPFSFSNRPLDRIAYARTSQFLDLPAAWTPTQFSGHLVYLPAPGASVTLPLGSQGALHFALFARGNGPVTFRISLPSGQAIFEKTVQVAGDLWEVHQQPVAGIREAVLSVTSAAPVRAGWGDLVSDSDLPAAVPPEPRPKLSYLKMGDIRCRPQLLSGWYNIEEGAWRWMAKEAEAVVRAPSGYSSEFALQLFFPPDYMERAGGPVTVSVTLDGKPLAKETYVRPGGYRMSAAAPRNRSTSPEATVGIRLNRALPPSGAERRELGAVVSALGFLEGK
jgi:hypothetical protein